jgi:hypothetical protein
MPRETRDARAAKGGFPPTPPPAPGEQGRRQTGSSARIRTPAACRTPSAATSNITSPPRVQRAPGVVTATSPAPPDRSGHNIGGEDPPPPSPTVQDHNGCARLRAQRRTLRSAGAGTTEGTMPTSTHGDASLGSPPPDLSQATTALPSSPSLLSPEEAETLDPDVDVAGKEASGGFPDAASDGFYVVKSRGGLQTLPRCDMPSRPGGAAAMPPIAPLQDTNPYAILRTTSSGAEASQAAAATLRDIVEDGFDEMFGDMVDCPHDDTRFWLRAIFREGAHLVDSMLNDVQGEILRLTKIESRLDTIES